MLLGGRRALACVIMAQQQPHPPQLLDRAAFAQVIRVPALRVPKQQCHELMRRLRGFTFDLPKTRCVVADGDREDVRLLLLKQELDPEALSPELTALLEPHGAFEVTSHDVTLDYSHLGADAVLKGVEVPSSFEAVGHIAHFNLRPESLPFKGLIGQVILDKNPTIKTVVNKVGEISNAYRVFDMEVIAGEERYETEVSQHGTRFRLDFSKVYWNSRLEAEHSRLVGQFKPGDVIADVMAGIGPFAVPAGLAGCKVYANDLNPDSAKYLALNLQLNRVSQQVLPFRLDGRQFIRLLLATPGGPAEQLQEQQPEEQQPEQQQQQQQEQQAGRNNAATATGGGSKLQKQPPPVKRSKLVAEVPPEVPPGFRPPPGGLLFDHAVMNLPASAVEFLDAFRGAFDPEVWQQRPLPWVHVYTFQKRETQADVIARVEAALGGKLPSPPLIHNVRDVAPNKLMLCVSFRVPAAVAFHGRQQQQLDVHQQKELSEPAAKKPKV